MKSTIKFLNKHLFKTIAIIIIVASNIWYWFFGIGMGLEVLILGMAWVFMSLSLIPSGMEFDWLRQDKLGL